MRITSKPSQDDVPGRCHLRPEFPWHSLTHKQRCFVGHSNKRKTGYQQTLTENERKKEKVVAGEESERSPQTKRGEHERELNLRLSVDLNIKSNIRTSHGDQTVAVVAVCKQSLRANRAQIASESTHNMGDRVPSFVRVAESSWIMPLHPSLLGITFPGNLVASWEKQLFGSSGFKMYLREVGYDDRDWINLTQDRDRWRAYVRAAMNLRVP
ncbi:hypothetical protein ANN_22918 [Periplaneta americana]|uniref:Uncharacterized protein n=1 Tax=Periplaneta americana TaxID=6978 RepID=A0ABQ8SKG2_PERAM|nr:hypothetical protein ANN_22918 [Periplaneta americana]